MTGADGKPRKLLQSLAAKTFMALAAASLPAIAIAIILGLTLVTKVSEAETDFNRANSATIVLNEMLVLIEKERGTDSPFHRRTRSRQNGWLRPGNRGH